MTLPFPAKTMFSIGATRNTDPSAKTMSGVEVQVEAQLDNSPLGQHVHGDGSGVGGGPDTDDGESLPDSGPTGRIASLASTLRNTTARSLTSNKTDRKFCVVCFLNLNRRVTSVWPCLRGR